MEYDSYFFLVTKYQLTVLGLWPKVGSFKIVYFIYSIIIRCFYLLFMITLIPASFLALPYLTPYQQADIMGNSVSFLLAVWKMFLSRKTSMRKLINDVVIFEKSLKGRNPDLETIYKKHSRSNFKLVMYVPLATLLCCISIVIATWIDLFEWKSLEKQGMESGKHLIYTQLLPYPEKYFGYYYVLQMFSAFVAGSYVSLADSLFLTLINYTIMRLQVLGVELKNLFENKERNLEETKAVLRNKILTHQAIISHVVELNENLKWFFLIDFTVKSYQISLVLLAFFDETIYRIPIRWILFKMSEIPVLFLGCGVLYFQANKIPIESQELSTAIYQSDWIGQPVEIMRSLMIMMVRTKRAFKIESFGVVILSNELILKICQAAYTYIVLQLAKSI